MATNLGKQFTFKTTKSTVWLRDLLESLPSKTRSDFIREMIITGMEHRGYVSWKGRKPVLFMGNMIDEDYEEEVATRIPVKSTPPPMSPQKSDTSETQTDQTTPPEEDPKKVLREDPPSDQLEDKTTPQKSDQNQIEKMGSVPPMPPPMETIVWTAFGSAEEVGNKLDSLYDDD